MNGSVSALVIALAAGGVALAYSPMPCACESTWQLVYAAAGLPATFPYRYYTPQQVERGMNRQLKGVLIRGSSSYYFDACKETKPRLLSCTLETEQAASRRRGYAIQMALSPTGRFERAHVRLHTSRR